MSPAVTDPELVYEAMAQAIKDALDAWPGLTALSYDPSGSDLPLDCVTVGAFEVETTPPEEAGDRLGFRDRAILWDITLYCDYTAPEVDWPRARKHCGRIVASIENDPTLAGAVAECSITRTRLEPNDPESPRRMLVGDFTLSIIVYQPNDA